MINLVVCDSWKVWEPKRGRHGGQKIFIRWIKHPKDSKICLDAIISKIKDDTVYMHKGQITLYQAQNNVRDLEEEEEYENIPILDKKLEEYKKHWVWMRTKKTAKRMLLR